MRNLWLAIAGVGAVIIVAVGLIMTDMVSLPFSSKVAEVEYGDEISPQLRSEIQSKVAEAFVAVAEGNQKKFLSLFVEEFQQQEGSKAKVDTIIQTINATVKNPRFENFTDCNSDYFVQVKTDQPQLVQIPCKGGFTFGNTPKLNLVFRSDTADYFINLRTVSAGQQQLMFGLIWRKFGEEWKLWDFDVGFYKTLDRSFVDWLNKADSYERKGYHIPALLTLQVGIANPQPVRFAGWAGQLKRAQDLYKDVTDGVKDNYKFPMKIESVESAPEVYYIHPQFAEGELIPEVRYVTKFELDDKEKIEAEAHDMFKVVRKDFPGLNKMASYIVFKAFNEPPVDAKKEYTAYGTVISTQ